MTFSWSCLANCSDEPDCPFCIRKQSTVWGQRWYYSFSAPLWYFSQALKAHWHLCENSCQPRHLSICTICENWFLGTQAVHIWKYANPLSPSQPSLSQHYGNLITLAWYFITNSYSWSKFAQSSSCNHSFLLFTSSLGFWQASASIGLILTRALLQPNALPFSVMLIILNRILRQINIWSLNIMPCC